MIRRIVLAGLVAAVVAAGPASATEVKIFQTQTQRAFLAGSLEGISADPLGRLRLADRVERLTAIGEPFLLSAAAHPQGWVVGTGNAGRVLLVRRDGSVEELFAAPEPEVFAVAADPDGTVWAGTSPNGKLYRIPPGGAAEPWLAPGETYIWAIERGPGGGLLLATGTQGRLYRVAGKDRGAVVYDSDDTHLRALAVAGGEVLVGTAGEGLVLVLEPAAGDLPWSARTVHDAREPEVVALAVAPDGTRYAALVASEASLVDLVTSAAGGGDGDDEPGEDGQGGGTVTVTVSPPAGASAGGTRATGSGGPRSTLLAISPAGVVETLTRLQDDTVFDLLWHRGSLWIATGLDGELYRWSGSELVLEKDVDERQIVALMPGDPGPAFATTNAAALFRVAGGTEREGLYTSATLDAEQIARFGTFRWRGEVPAGGALAFSFRSGISSQPDRTWSEWTPWQGDGAGDRDGDRESGEIALSGLPRGRYVQWRARLEAGGRRGEGASPLLYGIELTYRQENLRPRITDLDVLEPGRILVPATFNPGSQVFEPASPSRDSIFTTLEPSSGDGDPRLKTLWKPGFRSLTWDAEDDNGDELVYSLGFRPAGSVVGGDGQAEADEGWLAMVEELDAEHFSFDATVLPDGVYRFRVVASDRPANPAGAALAAERTSEPVVVDHTPPALVSVEPAGGGRLRVVLEDALLPLRQVRLSRDAAEWTDLAPEDGLLDGRRESFLVAAGDGVSGTSGRLLLLQAADAAYNGATYDLRRPPAR